MKLDIGGQEAIAAPLERVWTSLNDPEFLSRCIPGCRSMRELAPDTYAVHLVLEVVQGGHFNRYPVNLFRCPSAPCTGIEHATPTRWR